MIEKYFFLITRNDLLVCNGLENKKMIFSIDINQNISDFLKCKKI